MNGPFAGAQPRQPTPVGLNAEFYRHAATGHVHLQHCADCRRIQHPPRYRCRACTSVNLEWVPVDETGLLYSWTTTHFPFDRGWVGALPYTTGVIELTGGARIVAALSGVVSPRIDLPVRITTVAQEEGTVLLCITSTP